jgi:hypothetical protein
MQCSNMCYWAVCSIDFRGDISDRGVYKLCSRYLLFWWFDQTVFASRMSCGSGSDTICSHDCY